MVDLSFKAKAVILSMAISDEEWSKARQHFKASAEYQTSLKAVQPVSTRSHILLNFIFVLLPNAGARWRCQFFWEKKLISRIEMKKIVF